MQNSENIGFENIVDCIPVAVLIYKMQKGRVSVIYTNAYFRSLPLASDIEIMSLHENELLQLVHPDDRLDEHVPRARQDHDERPHRDPFPGGRVQPHPEPPVVDLGFAARIDLPARHRDPLPGHLVGEMDRDPPPHRRLRGRHLMVITQPLGDRGDRDVGLQPRLDLIPVRRDQRPRLRPQPRIIEFREPPVDQLRPRRSGQRRPAGLDTRRDRRGQIFADGFAVDLQ